MKKLLPQANSLDTLINVFIYFGNKKNCTIMDIASFCNFEPRQAQYYLSACIYLDLIDENTEITEYGKSLFVDNSLIREKIYERIISDEIIGKVFSHMLFFGDVKDFSYDLLKKYYPEYSDAVIERRASTLKNWCSEIIDYIKSNKNIKF